MINGQCTTLYTTTVFNIQIYGLKTCTGDNSYDFDSWVLSAKKVIKLMKMIPRTYVFAKAEDNLLKYLYSLP